MASRCEGPVLATRALDLGRGSGPGTDVPTPLPFPNELPWTHHQAIGFLGAVDPGEARRTLSFGAQTPLGLSDQSRNAHLDSKNRIPARAASRRRPRNGQTRQKTKVYAVLTKDSSYCARHERRRFSGPASACGKILISLSSPATARSWPTAWSRLSPRSLATQPAALAAGRRSRAKRAANSNARCAVSKFVDFQFNCDTVQHDPTRLLPRSSRWSG